MKGSGHSPHLPRLQTSRGRLAGVPPTIHLGARQIVRSDHQLKALRGIFITHQHSDHNLDYGNLFYLGAPTRLDRWPCCARAPSGHAAALPIPAMNSRRRIDHTRLR
jgi:hypothetical protein